VQIPYSTLIRRWRWVEYLIVFAKSHRFVSDHLLQLAAIERKVVLGAQLAMFLIVFKLRMNKIVDARAERRMARLFEHNCRQKEQTDLGALVIARIR